MFWNPFYTCWLTVNYINTVLTWQMVTFIYLLFPFSVGGCVPISLFRPHSLCFFIGWARSSLFVRKKQAATPTSFCLMAVIAMTARDKHFFHRSTKKYLIYWSAAMGSIFRCVNLYHETIKLHIILCFMITITIITCWIISKHFRNVYNYFFFSI